MAANYKINISDSPSDFCGENCACAEAAAGLSPDLIAEIVEALAEADRADAIDDMKSTVNILAEAVADLSATARLVSELVDEIYGYEA